MIRIAARLARSCTVSVRQEAVFPAAFDDDFADGLLVLLHGIHSVHGCTCVLHLAVAFYFVCQCKWEVQWIE